MDELSRAMSRVSMGSQGTWPHPSECQGPESICRLTMGVSTQCRRSHLLQSWGPGNCPDHRMVAGLRPGFVHDYHVFFVHSSRNQLADQVRIKGRIMTKMSRMTTVPRDSRAPTTITMGTAARLW